VLTVRRGPFTRLVLVSVLLLPVVSVAQAASPCAVAAPTFPTDTDTATATDTDTATDADTATATATDTGLGADLDLACRTVRAAVPAWHGRAVLRVVDGDPGVAAETLGAVVSIHREAWARLTPAGRQEVLTHELVHVATAPFTTSRTPTWLVEGLAEAIAIKGSGLADRVVAQELAAAVARGQMPAHLPAHLPTAHDFAATPALAYQESWLAVDLLLRRFGDPAVLRLYAAAGSAPLQDVLCLLDTCFGSGAGASDRVHPAGAVAGAGEALSPLGHWTRSGANGPDLVRAPEALTIPGLVAALRAEIVRRLS
jgi:hypothetical protein